MKREQVFISDGRLTRFSRNRNQNFLTEGLEDVNSPLILVLNDIQRVIKVT